MKITKRQLRNIIKEELSRVLTEASAQPPEIEAYLNSHGLDRGIDYEIEGDGVTEDYYIVALRSDPGDIVSRLDREMYPESPIGRARSFRDEIRWT